jgi:Uma2 family endonuclease
MQGCPSVNVGAAIVQHCGGRAERDRGTGKHVRYNLLIMTVAQEQPAVPRPKRWTREEYHHLGDSGLLPGRYELIEGEILEKMPKNRPHVLALMLLAAWLEDVFGRSFVQKQDPVVIPSPDEFASEPEPDVAVTKRPAADYSSDSPQQDQLVLVGEISDSTLSYDLGRKALLYATGGVPEYWVLDLAGRRLLVHRMPSTEGYREVRIYLESDEVATLARPNASTSVASLLPEAV